MNNAADFLFLLLLGIIVLNIIYKSLKEPEIISGIYQEKEKYKNVTLSNTDKKAFTSKLEELLIEEQVFLIHELTLSELASKMNLSSHKLSQIINENYQVTFFNLINQYRVEFSKKMIQNGRLEEVTIEGLAYDSGFNSRSAFNRAFKKEVGSSPKQYYEAIKNQISD